MTRRELLHWAGVSSLELLSLNREPFWRRKSVRIPKEVLERYREAGKLICVTRKNWFAMALQLVRSMDELNVADYDQGNRTIDCYWTNRLEEATLLKLLNSPAVLMILPDD